MQYRALLFAPLLALAACEEGSSPPTNPDGCLKCHRGIEHAHDPIPPTECAICHGGDQSGADKATAHIPVPDDWASIRGDGLPPAPFGFIEDFAPDQLDAIDPAYLRFINPGDIRVVDDTCGTCHAEHARNMGSSVMTTNAGHYYPTLLLAGLQDDRLAKYGSYGAIDPECDPSITGTSCELEPLLPPAAEEIDRVLASGDAGELEELAYAHYLAKNCNTCHQAGFPRNNSPGLYRSTGCTSCHVVYDTLGTYRGGDPTIPKGTPVHPAKHRITKAIPTEQCATCHFQGGRIGLLFRGIREGGFGSNTPPNAVPINETLYGHAPGYYFTDEDSTNDVDETPPDLHYAAGMHCADCHVGSDVHGDGRLYASSKLQLDLACEDCHGTVRERATPDRKGTFRTRKGRALPQLSQEGDGTVVLTGVVDGARHEVTQVADKLAPGGDASDAMRAAMAPDGDDWSHSDSITCDTCHTTHTLMCVGCHVSFDLRLSQVDYQTGLRTPGLTRGSRSGYTLSQLLLGTAPDGRVQTVHPSQQVQLTIVDPDGELLLGERGERRDIGAFRPGPTGGPNNGFVPFFQHTTVKKPRTCDHCHRTDDSPEEWARVMGVYGYGTGEFMLDAPGGGQVDAMQFLDEMGQPTTVWVHEGTGPVDKARETRALDVVVE